MRLTLEKGGGEKVEREGKPTGDPMNSKNRGAPVCEDCCEVVDDEVESGDERDIELDDTETNNDANKDAKRKAKLEEKIADDVAVDLALATGEQFTLLRRELMERYRKEEAEREVTTCTVAETKVPDAISQAGLEGSFPGGGFFRARKTCWSWPGNGFCGLHRSQAPSLPRWGPPPWDTCRRASGFS